jgi:hypothetical protein
VRGAVALLLWSTAPASTGQAAAPASVEEAAPATLTAAQMFALARGAEAAGDVVLAERALAALARDPDPDIRAEARFRLGQMKARRGDWRGAADQWAALLDEKPDAARVRLELANALAELGDEAGARRQLRRAQAAGLPPDVAQLVRRFDAALRSKRRVGGSIEVGLAPDTNINRAGADPTVDVNGLPFELDDDALARSGVGLFLAGQAYARPALTPRLNLLATLDSFASLYAEGRFNQAGLAVAVGPEHWFGRVRASLRPTGGLAWFGPDLHSTHVGLEGNLLAPVGNRAQVELLGGARRFDNRVNDAEDGWVYSLTARLERAFTPRFFGRASASAVRTAARDPAFASTAWTLGGLLAHDIGRMTVYAEGAAGELEGDEAFAFPAIRRSDRFHRFEAGLQLRALSWRGLSPLLRVSRTVNRSTIFFYDYDRTRIEAGLARSF